MSKVWLKFGCFLIGYNYGIIRNCSEISKKAVKRYTSALMIVCTLWAFIGYFFTQRYMHGGMNGSLIGAFVFVFVIIQIERQVILSVNPGLMLLFSRGLIAVMMAILGAIIIDQIIFKEDIELEKINSIAEKVNKALPPKTEELRSQIAGLDSAIIKKEFERQSLIDDIDKNPTRVIYNTQTSFAMGKSTSQDSSGKPILIEKPVPVTTTTKTSVINPKTAFVAPLEQAEAVLRAEKAEKEATLVNIRPQLEKEIGSKTGFLDELKVMYVLISGSGVALLVWSLWFFFFIGIRNVSIGKQMERKRN